MKVNSVAETVKVSLALPRWPLSLPAVTSRTGLHSEAHRSVSQRMQQLYLSAQMEYLEKTVEETISGTQYQYESISKNVHVPSTFGLGQIVCVDIPSCVVLVSVADEISTTSYDKLVSLVSRLHKIVIARKTS